MKINLLASRNERINGSWLKRELRARAKFLFLTASLIAVVLSAGGCADYASVGVYGDAYYVPDYRPLYVDYGYGGVPWWGPNVYYTRKKIVVKDVDRYRNVTRNINRNVYYGGHHFARHWGGGGFRRR